MKDQHNSGQLNHSTPSRGTNLISSPYFHTGSGDGLTLFPTGYSCATEKTRLHLAPRLRTRGATSPSAIRFYGVSGWRRDKFTLEVKNQEWNLSSRKTVFSYILSSAISKTSKDETSDEQPPVTQCCTAAASNFEHT